MSTRADRQLERWKAKTELATKGLDIVKEGMGVLKVFAATPFGGYLILRGFGFLVFKPNTPNEEKWASFVNTMFTASVIAEGLKGGVSLATALITRGEK